MNPMKIEALTVGTEVWLHVKRWDGDILEQTAVERINFSDLDGGVYSIAFENGMVQISGGYGTYWWCYDEKPKGVVGMAFDKRQYDQQYAKAHLTKKLISFNLDKPEDMKLLSFAESFGNFTNYIKRLIRQDMEKNFQKASKND